MKQKERVGINLLKRIKNDYVFRTFIFSTLSFFVTLVFTCYNLFLGVAHKAVWNIGIAVYYALLLIVRAYVIFSEAKFSKANLSEEQKESKRVKMYFLQSIWLFAIDFALVAPITLMVMQKKPNSYSIVQAITIATYTIYKITVSVRNYVKTRKEGNLSVRILRNVNFMDALVSLLSLQYTLIMACDGKISENMFTLCAISTFFIWVFLIIISALSVAKAVKINKNIGVYK